MTAPAEVVQPILAAHPELQLARLGESRAITIDSADVSGALCLSQDALPDFLMAWEWFRDRQRTGQPRCACGDSYTSHDITSKRRPCGRYGCGCAGFEAVA